MAEAKVCPHLGNRPAIVRAVLQIIPGAPTRADDLDTETRLCGVCAAKLVWALGKLERGEAFPGLETL